MTRHPALDDLNGVLKEKDEEIEALRSSLDRAREAMSRRLNMISDLRRQLNELETAVTKPMPEAHNLVAELDAENNALREKNRILTNDNDRLVVEVSSLRFAKSGAETNLHASQQKVEKLTERVAELEEMVASSDDGRVTLEFLNGIGLGQQTIEENNRLKAKVQDLETQLQSTIELSTHRLISMELLGRQLAEKDRQLSVYGAYIEDGKLKIRDTSGRLSVSVQDEDVFGPFASAKVLRSATYIVEPL